MSRPIAHGPDTDLLRRNISEIRNGKLDVSYLRITSLPPLPAGLRVLTCHFTDIVEFPTLPDTLEELNCMYNRNLRSLPKLPSNLLFLICDHNPQLRRLPELPRWLRQLMVHDTPLEVLPDIPKFLECLMCYNTLIREIPPLPKNLFTFSCAMCPNLSIQHEYGESIPEYNERWNQWREVQSMARIQGRNEIIKEDLIAEFWHPSRVEKMLETGGWDLIDSY